MTPSFAHFRGFLLATCLASGLAACASAPAPTTELADAQQAIVRASDADADQYAPQDIASAREALSRAQAAMSDGRAPDARNLALASMADADLARAKSEQARLNAQVAQRRSEVSDLQRRLQQEGGR